jgi:Predicted transcriptional regulators
MEIAERLRYIRKALGKTQLEFADSLGMKQGSYSDVERGRTKNISDHILKTIGRLYNVSIDYLMTGEGNMFTTDEDREPYLITKSGTKYYELPNGMFKMVVPFVPAKAYAGYVDEFKDAEFVKSLEEREFTVREIHHGRYYSFEIKGDSMDDDSKRSLSNGDIVLARDLGREHWKDGLRIKDYSAWIIVLKNTIVCKQIVEQDMEAGIITCHSLNPSPEYCDFKLHLDEIQQLLNIVKRESDY